LKKILRLDPYNSYSHFALAKLEARREKKYIIRNNGRYPSNKRSARIVFSRGTKLCPKSIHLWQAWAHYEQQQPLMKKELILYLLDKALEIDSKNPYVYHALGTFELLTNKNETRAIDFFKKGIKNKPTAALVCSLCELYTQLELCKKARKTYQSHIHLLTKRDVAEVYLAASSLEERYFNDLEGAYKLILKAVDACPSDSRVHVAKVRLERKLYKTNDTNYLKTKVKDGRLFNALANVEVKAGRLNKARKILRLGMKEYPNDQSLFQAAGKVEERVGNFDAAKRLYSTSLFIEPSAPALVAYAMLELRNGNEKNIAKIQGLFEEALLLDPRHGPAYNAYGTMELRLKNIDNARRIFERGIQAQCSDPASVYHGYAKVELAYGDINKARTILRNGLQVIDKLILRHRTLPERSTFLIHTMGMIELNCYHVAEAKNIFELGLKKYSSNSSQLLLGKALCYVKLGKEDSARRYFQKAVKSNAKHAHSWQAWGMMEMRAGYYLKAQQLWEKGIQNNPRHGALWLAYAFLESRIGNTNNARTLYAAGVSKCPHHVPLLHAWSNFELGHCNYYRAKRLIGEALTRDKAQASGWLTAAKIEQKQGNTGLVGLILRRGLECAPDPELYCALADWELRRGKVADARSLLEKSIDADPFHAPSYHALAELEAKVFNLEGLSKLNKKKHRKFFIISSLNRQNFLLKIPLPQKL